MKSIGKNIKNLRTKKHMTQDDLAEKLLVSRQTVSNYETGKSQPDIDMLMNIAEALSVDINTIIYGKKPEDSLNNTESKKELKKIAIWAIVLVLLGVLHVFLKDFAEMVAQRDFVTSPLMFVMFIMRPAIFILLAWTGMRVIAFCLKAKRPDAAWLKYVKYVVIAVIVLYFAIFTWMVGEMLFANMEVWELRQQEVDFSYESHSTMPLFLSNITWRIVNIADLHFLIFIPLGVLLWFTGGKKKKKKEEDEDIVKDKEVV